MYQDIDSCQMRKMINLVTKNAAYRRHNTRLAISYDEFVSEGFLHLCESLSRYSCEKGNSAYAYLKKRVEGSMIDLARGEIRKNRQTEQIVRSGKEECVTPPFMRHNPRSSIESQIHLREFVQFLSKISPILSGEEKDLLQMYFYDEKSLFEIAEKYNTNKHVILRRINKLKNRLGSLYKVYKNDNGSI
jgi:RNA polymerase sigma factor (sigma-70 family)